MKKTKNTIAIRLFIIVVILFTFSSCKDETVNPMIMDRTARWNQDLDYCSTQLSAKHIDFSKIISKVTFDSGIDKIKNSIGSLQDFEVQLELQKLLAAMGVAHTCLIPPVTQSFHFLPIVTYDFKDGLFIIKANLENQNLLGKKITKIGGFEIQTVKDSLAKIISHENSFWLKGNLPKYISIAEALKFCGIVGSLTSVQLELEGIGSITLQTNDVSQNFFTFGFYGVLDNKTIPLYMQNQSNYYWYNYISAKKTLYLKYNVCANMNNKSFADFTKEISNFISANQVDKFVLDLRDNTGGNSEILNPLQTYLTNSPLNTSGKLYVLIGRSTFSSGMIGAIRMKLNTKAILVGESTGGKPNHYGNVLQFQLPNSGASIQYCKNYFELLSDDPDTVSPDVKIEISSQNYMAGNDPVLDYIVK